MIPHADDVFDILHARQVRAERAAAEARRLVALTARCPTYAEVDRLRAQAREEWARARAAWRPPEAA